MRFLALILLSLVVWAPGALASTVLLTPDSVTGELSVRLTTSTDDARIVRTCLYRIDSNSPDPFAEVVCGSFQGGEPMDPNDLTKGFIGVLTWNTVLVPSEDQLYTARNFADVGDGMEIVSSDSANSGLLPRPVMAPLFIVRAPPTP